MFAFMMMVFLAWSRDGRASATSGGWLESVRRANFASVTGTAAAEAAPGAPGRKHDDGTIDDDEHLAAYNEYLARLNAAPRDAGRPQS
jgi:hypothetical protein